MYIVVNFMVFSWEFIPYPYELTLLSLLPRCAQLEVRESLGNLDLCLPWRMHGVEPKFRHVYRFGTRNVRTTFTYEFNPIECWIPMDSTKRPLSGSCPEYSECCPEFWTLNSQFRAEFRLHVNVSCFQWLLSWIQVWIGNLTLNSRCENLSPIVRCPREANWYKKLNRARDFQLPIL